MWQVNSSDIWGSHILNVTFDKEHLDSRLTAFLYALPFILIVLCIGISLSNAVVLAAFVKNRRLCTPFNIYLINLLLADLAQALFDLPFTVLSEFTPIWQLGKFACNFNLYGKWVFTAVVRNTHVLISLNRLWALFFPIYYKIYHTRSTAIILTVGVWIYVHIFLLPGIIPDDLYYRFDDGSCLVNTTANRAWALPTQLILYNSTVFIVGFTYPIIWWKIRQRRTLTQRRRVAVLPHQIDLVAADWVTATIESLDNDTLMKVQDSQSFAVLTYLVISVIFCWTPIMIFFTMQILFDYNNYIHFITGSLLYYLSSLLDPIFFTMAIPPLRKTLLTLLVFSWNTRRVTFQSPNVSKTKTLPTKRTGEI